MSDADLFRSLADSLEWALDAARDYHVGARRSVEWAVEQDRRGRQARELVAAARERVLAE